MFDRKIITCISLLILILPVCAASSSLDVSIFDSLCIHRGNKKALNKNIALLRNEFKLSFLENKVFLDSVYYIDMFAILHNGNGNMEYWVYNPFSSKGLNRRFIELMNNFEASKKDCTKALAYQNDSKWCMKLMVPILFIGMPIGMVMSIHDGKGSPYVNLLGIGIGIGSFGYSAYSFIKFFHNQYMFEKTVDQAIYRYNQGRIIQKANE